MGVGTAMGVQLRLESVTVRNVSDAVLFNGESLFVEDARFVGNNFGVASVSSGESSVLASTFDGSASRGVIFYEVLGGSSGLVSDCAFVDNLVGIDSQVPNTFINDCTVTGGVVGIQSTFQADVTVTNCTLLGQSTALYVPQDAALHLYNNLVGGNPGTCLHASGTITGQANILEGGSVATIRTMHTAHWDFHDNHILHAVGPLVLAPVGGSFLPVVTHDLSNNYWGTTDPAQIAAWITDNADDSGIRTLIDFEPFHAEPVPTETHSFGQLRALFGGN